MDIRIYKYDTAICDNPNGILEGACVQCWNKHNPDKQREPEGPCINCIAEGKYHGIDNLNSVHDPALDLSIKVPPLFSKNSNHTIKYINIGG